MWVVSEHEDWVMKRGILSPPAGPIAFAPRATYRSEHVPSHDRGAHTRSPPREEVIVESLASAFSANHLVAASGSEQPIVDLHTTYPEWIVEILMGSSGVTIQRDREIAHEQPGH
jgi:hypothetical protein